MSVAEFLAWEERQELRCEFDGFQAVAMTGGTMAHEDIGGNIRTALQNRLGVGRCRVFGPILKIKVAGRTRTRSWSAPISPRSTVVRDPVLVFEVLSKAPPESTALRTARIWCHALYPALRAPGAGCDRGDGLRAQER
jgi:hypothetical protein